MNSPEDLRELLKKLLALELTDKELEDHWQHLEKNKLTPSSRHGGNNIGFSPRFIMGLISQASKRSGLDITHSRFKKIREEIYPAIFFALLLKKLGYAEFILVPSDVPDIVFVDYKSVLEQKKRYRVRATPLECMFLSKEVFEATQVLPTTEHIAKIIIEKKFAKAYRKETILLVTVAPEDTTFELNKLSVLLQGPTNPFHQIWILIGQGTEGCILARLTPEFEMHNLNIPKDLLPHLY